MFSLSPHVAGGIAGPDVLPGDEADDTYSYRRLSGTVRYVADCPHGAGEAEWVSRLMSVTYRLTGHPGQVAEVDCLCTCLST